MVILLWIHRFLIENLHDPLALQSCQITVLVKMSKLPLPTAHGHSVGSLLLTVVFSYTPKKALRNRQWKTLTLTSSSSTTLLLSNNSEMERPPPAVSDTTQPDRTAVLSTSSWLLLCSRSLGPPVSPYLPVSVLPPSSNLLFSFLTSKSVLNLYLSPSFHIFLLF